MRAYRVREAGDAFVLPDDVYGLVRREVLAEVKTYWEAASPSDGSLINVRESKLLEWLDRQTSP